MYKQRLSFAFDFYLNLHATQLAIPLLLLLFHIVTHNFSTSELKFLRNALNFLYDAITN